MFDRNKITPEIPSQAIDMANAVVERLRNRKVPQIVLPEAGTGLRVCNLVRCYLQAHVRRCLIFIEAGAAELDLDRPLAAELCTRAIYENAATICDFADKLKPLCEAVDYEGVETHVTKAAFATRIPSFLEKQGEDAKAPNVLTQIDKMNRRYSNYRTAYDHLSDIVHPNGLGAVVYFGKFTEPGIMSFFDVGTSESAERARASLIVAALMLLHVELALQQTDERLERLSADMARRHDQQKKVVSFVTQPATLRYGTNTVPRDTLLEAVLEWMQLAETDQPQATIYADDGTVFNADQIGQLLK